jgi:AcrR family transcriptional regulator
MNSSGDIGVTKDDSVVDLLASIEKIKMNKIERPLTSIFDNAIEPVNLREKFLYATFEIIAEKGADALSANELIKRTRSSKGALFHHFETIDHLCIESLHFFRKHFMLGLSKDGFSNIEDYLKHIVVDCLRKRSSSQYAHLINFFRDRAIRDERYREPLKMFTEVFTDHVANRILDFLPPGVNRNEVMDKTVFLSITIECVGYQRALTQNPDTLEAEVQGFLAHMIQAFKAVC